MCVCVGCQTLFQPQKGVYEQLSTECVAQGCCVDLFLFPSQYTDVATMADVPSHTGGSVHKYNNFQVGEGGKKPASRPGDGPNAVPVSAGGRGRRAFPERPEEGRAEEHRVRRHHARPHQHRWVAPAGTAALREGARRSRDLHPAGFRATDFFGAVHMRNTTDIEMAAVDCGKAVTVELKHDDALSEEAGAFLQVRGGGGGKERRFLTCALVPSALCSTPPSGASGVCESTT